MSSLKQRFLSKIIRSGIAGGLIIVTLPLITRGLGAEQFGLFNYIKIILEKVIQFIDSGTSAFYPKLSQRPADKSIIKVVVFYEALIIPITFILLITVFLFGGDQSLLATDSLMTLISILGLVWLILISQKLTNAMDAIGKTIQNEIALTLTRIAQAFGWIILYVFGELDLKSFILTQIFVLSAYNIFMFIKAFIYFSSMESKSRTIKDTINEFKVYCLPLFAATTVGAITVFFDRWLLQKFGGTAEQGYYSLGFNLFMITIFFTACFTPLILREYSIAHENNDKHQLTYLFKKYIPLFYVIATTFACFFAVNGEWITILLGGEEFSLAAPAVIVMCFAPIHQTLGLLSGNLMIATDRTGIYGKIAIFTALLGVPLTYFTLAPLNYWGLGLGAVGLALKIVVFQIVMVNIQLWYNTRYLGISMSQFILHQVGVVLLVGTIAFISKSLIAFVLNDTFTALIVSCFLYMFIIVITIFFFPNLIAMTRSEILNHLKKFTVYIRL